MTEDQKRNQSKGQTRIKDQGKQAVGRPHVGRPTLDARETSVKHMPESKQGKSKQKKKKRGTCIWATRDKHRLSIQAREA